MRAMLVLKVLWLKFEEFYLWLHQVYRCCMMLDLLIFLIRLEMHELLDGLRVTPHYRSSL